MPEAMVRDEDLRIDVMGGGEDATTLWVTHLPSGVAVSGTGEDQDDVVVECTQEIESILARLNPHPSGDGLRRWTIDGRAP